MYIIISLALLLDYICGDMIVFFSIIDDPQAGVGENVHFQDFTFAPDAGQNFS